MKIQCCGVGQTLSTEFVSSVGCLFFPGLPYQPDRAYTSLDCYNPSYVASACGLTGTRHLNTSGALVTSNPIADTSSKSAIYPRSRRTMATPSWPYATFADLQKDYPGIHDADSLHATTALQHQSRLALALYQLRHGTALPTKPEQQLTAHQLVTAVLLTFEERSATRAEIMTTMMKMPSIAASLPTSFLSQLPKITSQYSAIWGPATPAIKIFKAVSALLDADAAKHFCDFPIAEALAPSDPAAYEEWRANVDKEIAAETRDPEDEIPFCYEYAGGDWVEEFDTEVMRRQRARGPDVHKYTLKPLKECCMFDDYLDGWRAEGFLTFHVWALLPTELQEMVLEHAFSFAEPLRVRYRGSLIGQEPQTHEEELTELRFEFRPFVKTSLALVAKDGSPQLRNIGGTLDLIRNPSSVSYEFGNQFSPIFYGNNTFEIEDDRDDMRVGTHRWLELMERRGYLQKIRRLNIMISIGEEGQTKWHLRRIAWSILTMAKLERLVVNVDMGCFVSAYPRYFDPDYHFPYDNASIYPEQWAGVRMLMWADPAIDVFIPHFREMEDWLKGRMVMLDTRFKKFWVDTDWFDPSGTFPNATIAATVAGIESRQLAVQGVDQDLIDKHHGFHA